MTAAGGPGPPAGPGLRLSYRRVTVTVNVSLARVTSHESRVVGSQVRVVTGALPPPAGSNMIPSRVTGPDSELSLAS